MSAQPSLPVGVASYHRGTKPDGEEVTTSYASRQPEISLLASHGMNLLRLMV
jgi:hypothetical protein